MTSNDDRQHRSILERIARRVMLERGLAELEKIHGPSAAPDGSVRNLRDLPWCSIDVEGSSSTALKASMSATGFVLS